MLSRREKFHPSFHFCLMAAEDLAREAFDGVVFEIRLRNSEGHFSPAKSVSHHPIKIADIFIINSSWNHFWLRFYETLNLIRKNGRRKGKILFSFLFSFIWLNIFSCLVSSREMRYDGGEWREQKMVIASFCLCGAYAGLPLNDQGI